jgi:hypothetical protein
MGAAIVMAMNLMTIRSSLHSLVATGLTLSLLTFALPGCGGDDTGEGSGGSDGGSGGSDPGTGGSEGGSGGSDGGSGGAGGSEICNEIDVSAAPVVEVVEVAMDPPTPTGGDFSPGMLVTSHLTAITRYTGVGGTTGPTGETRQEVNVCDETTCSAVIVLSSSPGEQRFTWDMAFEGTNMEFTETCGGGVSAFTIPYSLVGTVNTLHQGATHFVYTRL